MRARILDAAEWSRLDIPSMPPLFPFVDPRNVAVVVVEDGDRIAACMTVLNVTHFEGAWVDPEFRGNAGVMRALLRHATELARARGEQWVIGGAADGDDAMHGFIKRLGGKFMPARFAALGVGRT